MDPTLSVTAAEPALQREDYTSEIRFGVVMYGGVSLAIYINGVTNEMFEMACATPRWRSAAGPAPSPGTLDGAAPSAPAATHAQAARKPDACDSREAFRRLSWLAGNPALRARYATAIRNANDATPCGPWPQGAWNEAWVDGQPRTRLVVDVVSGTSAGGINGIFLAKALANGADFSPLRKLWVGEGDISLLLNDARSRAGLTVVRPDTGDKPASLLNSDRMYLKLLSALDDMPALGTLPTPSDASPLVDEIDLFVTTTDIVGAQVPLRLSDMVVQERRHKHVFHFGFPEGTNDGNDFANSNNPFLAFAARCTSSFPFAFEPMNLHAMLELSQGSNAKWPQEPWNRYFSYLPKETVDKAGHAYRAYGDGGYLDNKPFSYVVDTLSHRQAEVPMERKLIYVEPAPEKFRQEPTPSETSQPDALSNALAALTKIPQYETIREDLQAVLKRNQRVERVENIVRLSELAVEAQEENFQRVLREKGGIPPWAQLKLSTLVNYHGAAILPYRRLRVFVVTDMLAEHLARLWDVDREADHFYALRALVRVWRERHYEDETEPDDARETNSAFLDQFDLGYRVRRLRFLLRKVDQATRVLRQQLVDITSPGGKAVGARPKSDTDRQIVDGLRRRGYDLEHDTRVDAASLGRALQALGELKKQLLQIRITIQRAERDERARHAREHPMQAALRKDLQRVLELLLAKPESRPPPVELIGRSEKPIPVKLDENGLGPASATQTQQERLMQRARYLFDAAGGAEPTLLQDALESSLEPMRIKRSARSSPGPDSALGEVNEQVKHVLGMPRLTVCPDDVVRITIQNVAGNANMVTQVLNSFEGTCLRNFLGHYYIRFDAFDQLSFPLYYDTGVGEPATVDVVRISPSDATRLVDEASDPKRAHKLAGTTLFNFGAFLDERWRRHDIMWGRLDGVERLITCILPQTDADTTTVRNELIDRAQANILREALVEKGQGDLTALLCEALNDNRSPDHRPAKSRPMRLLRQAGAWIATKCGKPPQPDSPDKDILAKLMATLQLDDPIRKDRLRGILTSLLDEQQLVQFVRADYDVNRDLEPKATLEAAARAVTVTGRVLDGIARRNEVKTALPRWLARAGLMAQGLIAVSLPGSLNQRWWSHGIKVLYAFELTLLAAAMLFGGPDARNMAVTVLGATLAVHVASLVVGDAMVWGRRKLVQWLVFATIVGVLVLALLGVVALNNAGWRTILCGTTGKAAAGGWQHYVCASLSAAAPSRAVIASGYDRWAEHAGSRERL